MTSNINNMKKTVLVILLSLTCIAYAGHVQVQQENLPDIKTDHFLTLSAECNADNRSIVLTLHTSEPFYGSLYSRDFQSTCKISGEGLTATKLVISPEKQCGVQMIRPRDYNGNLFIATSSSSTTDNQENTIIDQQVQQVALYVQHDEYVQQVIDEQFLVQCWEGMAQGLVSYQDGYINFVDKTLSKSITAFTMDNNSNSKKKAAEKAKELKKTKKDKQLQRRTLHMVDMEPMTVQPPPPEKNHQFSGGDIITGGRDQNMDIIIMKDLSRSEARKRPPKSTASGWMELVGALTGQTLDGDVGVGDPVSLVIRLRQLGSRDTMLSTCTASSGSEVYDLTDFKGCTADSDILPNFKAAFNSRTGVKRLTTTFPMFKFPDAKSVTIRCSVMVCKKNCPVAKCNNNNNNINVPEDLAVNIVDKFVLETYAEVIESDLGNFIADEQLMRTPLRSEDADSLRSSAANSYHKSDYHVDTNAVRASSITKQDETYEAEEGEEVDELLCLSPSRLALAFGILLVILLLALVASCTMWMRARSYMQRPKPSNIMTRPPRPPPGTIVHSPRGPFLVGGPRPPYIRVLQ